MLSNTSRQKPVTYILHICEIICSILFTVRQKCTQDMRLHWISDCHCINLQHCVLHISPITVTIVRTPKKLPQISNYLYCPVRPSYPTSSKWITVFISCSYRVGLHSTCIMIVLSQIMLLYIVRKSKYTAKIWGTLTKVFSAVTLEHITMIQH